MVLVLLEADLLLCSVFAVVRVVVEVVVVVVVVDIVAAVFFGIVALIVVVPRSFRRYLKLSSLSLKVSRGELVTINLMLALFLLSGMLRSLELSCVSPSASFFIDEEGEIEKYLRCNMASGCLIIRESPVWPLLPDIPFSSENSDAVIICEATSSNSRLTSVAATSLALRSCSGDKLTSVFSTHPLRTGRKSPEMKLYAISLSDFTFSAFEIRNIIFQQDLRQGQGVPFLLELKAVLLLTFQSQSGGIKSAAGERCNKNANLIFVRP